MDSYLRYYSDLLVGTAATPKLRVDELRQRNNKQALIRASAVGSFLS